MKNGPTPPQFELDVADPRDHYTAYDCLQLAKSPLNYEAGWRETILSPITAGTGFHRLAADEHAGIELLMFPAPRQTYVGGHRFTFILTDYLRHSWALTVELSVGDERVGRLFLDRIHGALDDLWKMASPASKTASGTVKQI